MGKRWKRLWRDRSGEGYVDMVVLVLCGMLVLALCVQVLPVFVKKQQLDVFATELVREAEISGRVGAETDRREESLIEKTGLEPDISWSQEGRIQLNKDVSVTLTYETNIGLFGKFRSRSHCGQRRQGNRRCIGNKRRTERKDKRTGVQDDRMP